MGNVPLQMVPPRTALAKGLYYAVLVILSLLGLVALGLRLAQGMRVTALTSYISWGQWVAMYIYFIGLSAGSFLLSTLVYVFGMRQFERIGRMALLSALFSLVGGLLFIWVDLGHPERFWEIFATPHWVSVMTIESWLYVLYLILILAELWLLMRDDLAAMAGAPGTRSGLRRRLYRILALGYRPPATPEGRAAAAGRVRRWLLVLGIVGVPTAIGVHGGTGSIFAVAVARPYWNSGLFPIVFLVSALASGAALLTFLYAFYGRREEGFSEVLWGLASLTGLFLALDLLLLAAEVLVGLYSGVPEHVDVFHAMMAGRYSLVFWVGQLGLAGSVPLLILLATAFRKPTSLEPLFGKALPVSSGVRWTGAAAAILALAADAVFLPRLPGHGLALWVGSWFVMALALVGLVLLTGPGRFWLGLGGLGTVLGIVAVRLNIVIPGFVVPELAGLERAYVDPRLVYRYFPSPLEWASTVGLVALLTLLFSLAFELLPTHGREEVEP